MSLSWRLIISYIIVILVSLTLVFLTLLFVSRPIQNRLATSRLSSQAQAAARQINGLYRRGDSTEQVIQQLERRFANRNNHLVLIDSQGNVLVDTQDIWLGQQFPEINRQSGTVNSPDDGPSLAYAATTVGPSNNPAGKIILLAPQTPLLATLISEFAWGFLLAGVVALLLSLLLSIFIARSIAMPLKRVAQATSAVASGDYEYRLPETGPPEIKRVSTSFNVMIGQVQASQKAMRDFVSNVSHELKTPLTSIHGFSQAIQEGATQDEAAIKRAAGIIHQEAARMSRMVEDLLDLAKIDSGQIAMRKTPLDITQILRGTFDRLLPQAVKKDIKLIADWDKLPIIVGDGDRLAQVFTNFLDNAVKHTPTGGQVTITGKVIKGIPRPRPIRPDMVKHNKATIISERSDFTEISINDTGPGIPPEDLGRIFERFYQVDKSRQQSGGTGLGLAITQEIIEAHGGYVRANSTLGQGTTFTVLLPITEADAKTLITTRYSSD